MSDRAEPIMAAAQAYESARERRVQGNIVGAVARYRKAVELAEAAGDSRWATAILVELGEMHQEGYDLLEARRVYGEALQRLVSTQEIEGSGLAALVHRRRAEVELMAGDLEAARAGFQRTVELYLALEEPCSAGEIYVGLARREWDSGQKERAIRELGRAWSLYTEAPQLAAESGRAEVVRLLREWKRRMDPERLRERLGLPAPDSERLWEMLE